jgi:hypothetical protein
VFTDPLLRHGIHNIAVLLLRVGMLFALPSNGYIRHSIAFPSWIRPSVSGSRPSALAFLHAQCSATRWMRHHHNPRNLSDVSQLHAFVSLLTRRFLIGQPCLAVMLLDFCSGGTQFESRPAYLLSRLTFFVGLLSPSRQTRGKVPQLRHNHFIHRHTVRPHTRGVLVRKTCR